MNNQADNHQADNWVDKENDVNEKKLRLFKTKKICKRQKNMRRKKVAFFLKKGGVNSFFFLHKSQKSERT